MTLHEGHLRAFSMWEAATFPFVRGGLSSPFSRPLQRPPRASSQLDTFVPSRDVPHSKTLISKTQLRFESLNHVVESSDLPVVDQRYPNGTGSQPPDDYYANFGKAIETIKRDFPCLFRRDFDYSIYRADLVFRDPVNSFQGLRFYRYMLLSLRWHGRIFFKRVDVRVHNMWPIPEGTIRVRWSIHGIPRIPWEAESIFDGCSEYKLDRHGMIYEHAVDNLIFRDPPVLRLPVLFAQLNPVAEVSNPIPSAWYRWQRNRECFYVHRFSWVRMYFVLSVVMSILKSHSME